MAKSVIAISNSGTQVSKITVGRPVRRVTEGVFKIDVLGGVDTSTKENGSLLIYDATSEKWVASRDLEEQNINGGTY